MVLALAAIFIAVMSEFVAGSVEATCKSLGLTEVFAGVIIVAIIGNASEFSLPEVASLSLAVGIVVLISGDGECNWFEGAQLLAVYLIIAVLFFFLPAR